MAAFCDMQNGCVDVSRSKVSETPRRVYKWKIVWPNTVAMIILHLTGLYGWYLYFTSCMVLSIIWAWLFGMFSGLGITIGAHRFYAHKAFKCNKWIRVLLVIAQTMIGQVKLSTYNVRWRKLFPNTRDRTNPHTCMYTWVHIHRQHHKNTDTDADPHNATRGFFFAHIGWVLVRRQPEVRKGLDKIDMTDLEMDPFVMFQKKYYLTLFAILGVLFPMLVPHILWGESLWNGFFMCGMARLVTTLNFTCLVNSAAHFYGNKPFTKDIMPAENAWVSFVAMGEGWHNYHHTFPWDYRTSEFGQRLNLSTTLIDFLARRGWVWDLKMATPAMVRSRVMKRGDGTHPVALKWWDTIDDGVEEEEKLSSPDRDR